VSTGFDSETTAAGGVGWVVFDGTAFAPGALEAFGFAVAGLAGFGLAAGGLCAKTGAVSASSAIEQKTFIDLLLSPDGFQV
jgi:hypothetical protein